MKSKGINLDIYIIALIGLGFFILNLSIVMGSSLNYTPALEKGTQIMEIDNYDSNIWKITVDANSTPRNWFQGESDKIGAKSKATITDWWENDLNTYSMFDSLIIPRSYLSIFYALENYGYNYSYINDKYRDYYNIWQIETYSYSFTENGFKNTSNSIFGSSLILKYPENISKLLDDYNELAGIINNDTELQSLNLSLPILSGDEYLWQYVLKRMPLANPVPIYLSKLIDSLQCENVTLQGNSLTIKRVGLSNFTSEITYNTQGNFECFILKNSDKMIFYRIMSYNPKTTVLIILAICSLSTVSLSILHFYIKKKIHMQTFKQ